jgi:hypothetical protein
MSPQRDNARPKAAPVLDAPEGLRALDKQLLRTQLELDRVVGYCVWPIGVAWDLLVALFPSGRALSVRSRAVRHRWLRRVLRPWIVVVVGAVALVWALAFWMIALLGGHS